MRDSAVWVRQAACEGTVLLASELQASAACSSGLEHLLQSLMELLPREPQLDLLEKAAAAATAILQELSSDEAQSILSTAAPAIFQVWIRLPGV